MKSELIDNRIVVWNVKDSKKLFMQGYYGKPIGMPKPKIEEINVPLILDLIEGYYLLQKSKISIWLSEESILIKQEVKAICDILGLDPMEIANEGKAILCVEGSQAETCLKQIQTTEIGRNAKIIGEVKAEKPGLVVMRTPLGGKRVVEKPMGELIPRIC